MARPREVDLAVQLIWASVCVALLGVVYQVWQLPVTYVRLLFAGGSIAVSTLFTWWVTSRLAAGRSWMRTLVVVLVLADLPFVIADVPAQFGRSPVRGTLYVFAHGLSYVVLYLLLRASSRRWFRQRSQRSREVA